MIGKTISHYRIDRKLGEGGMGVVYQAEDLDLQVSRALKFLPPHAVTGDQDRARLEREARAAASLEHSNICPVHEIGRADDQTFIVMSYLDGRTLAERLKSEGSLPVDEALHIAVQVGSALSRAHAAGVVHRDIKPANIMLTGESSDPQQATGGLQAMVMDFGLAQAADFTRMTKTGTTLGTAAYMSPEQSRGQTVDAPTDVWSLGVVLYEMLTGRQPFKGDHLAAVALAVQKEDPEPVTQLRPEVPDDLARVIERALAKEPEQRYQTADELLADLQAVRDKQELGHKTAQHARRRRLKRRKRLLYGILAAVVVIAAGILWWSRYQSVRRIDALAVLPFANLSGDAEQEYFVDGMTDALITELQQLAADQLRVISRTSIMRYKETDLTLPEIAAELGVDVIVEASVVRTGELVKVAAKLIRARPQEQQMWADSYERDMQDVLALHAQVARSVAEQVQLVLDPESTERLARSLNRTVDPEVYDQFLLGKHWVGLNDVDKALPYFEKAIAIDSTYAPAWAWAAHCHIMPTHWQWPLPEEVIANARALAERAIELEPEYADGYFILAHILWEHDWDMPAAGQALARGFQLNSESSMGHLTNAFFNNALDRSDRAVPAMRRSLELDPFNRLYNTSAYQVYSFAGLHNEAMESIRRAKELYPDWDERDAMAWAHYWKGDYAEAIRIREELMSEAENDFQKRNQLGMLAQIHTRAGARERGRELYLRLLSELDLATVKPGLLASIYADLGDKDEAFRLIEIAYEQKDMFLVWLKTWPSFSGSLAGDPRYEHWLSKIGLVD